MAISRRTIEVRCLPTAIPEFLLVDVSALQIGDSIHVNDVQLPEGVEIPPHVNYSIVSVVAPEKEEVVAPVEGVVASAEVPATAQAPVAEAGAGACDCARS